jgi:hypothetical protein
VAIAHCCDLHPAKSRKLSGISKIRPSSSASFFAGPLRDLSRQRAAIRAGALRDLSVRGDIIKTIHRAIAGAGREPDLTGFALDCDQAADPVQGRLVARGLHDELRGTAYAVVDGVDGRTHRLIFSDLEVTGDAKLGAVVEMRTYENGQGRKRSSLATRSDLTIEAQVTPPCHVD